MKVKGVSQLKRLQKVIKKRADKGNKLVKEALNKTLGKVNTQVIRKSSQLTGVAQSSLRKQHRLIKASEKRLVAQGIYKPDYKPNLMSLKRTRYNKSKGIFTYTWLGKRYTKRGLLAKGLGGAFKSGKNKGSPRGLAVRNVKTGSTKPKYYRSRRGQVKTVKSGKHIGKRYTSGWVQSYVGGNYKDVFKHDPFIDEMETFIEFELPRQIAAKLRRIDKL